MSSHNPPCSQAYGHSCSAKWNDSIARDIVRQITATYEDNQNINHLDGMNMPQSRDTLEVLEQLLEVLFPGYSGRHPISRTGLEFVIGDHVNQIFRSLRKQVVRAFLYRCRRETCNHQDCATRAEDAVLALLRKLPEIRHTLKSDAAAAMNGDPAATAIDEIVIAYPGFRATAIHRIAHELYQAQVPLIPRIMSEHAHTTTGIDIHPGATIGEHFFIDHGTGVVIGETAIIGNNVKIYQGVTLGALSFPKDAGGKVIKGAKRHPNIEDDVTIYAGATILGDITIGRGSVIGGNVWLTDSIPAETRITIAPPELSIRTRSSQSGNAKPA